MIKKVYSISYLEHFDDRDFIRTFCSSLEKARKVHDYLLKFYPVVCEPIDYDLDMFDYLIDD